jgi:isochorismate hydrolase
MIPTIERYELPTADTIPANQADWCLDWTRAVLLVHDMQGYFVNLFPDQPREALVQNCALMRKVCAAEGAPVAYTAQPGRMAEADRGLLADFWGAGMRTEPEDREIVTQLRPDPADWVLTKWRYSAFFRTDLLERMRAANRDQLIVCGVYAHVGVLVTAIEAFTHDIEPFLVADATGDFSEEFHRLALNYVAQRCGKVMTTGGITS